MTRIAARTRNSPFPDLANGAATVHHMTDTHIGAENVQGDPASPAWLIRWMTSGVEDAIGLNRYVSGHVHTGDMIEWGQIINPAPQDAAYVDFRNRIKAGDGKPWAEAVGNHDLGSFDSPGKIDRPTSAWESALGLGAGGKNKVTQMGSMKVITVGPDSWGYDGAGNRLPYVLSSATLTWLAQQLAAAGSTPCWVASHCPLEEQLPGGDSVSRANIGDSGALVSVLAAYPNAIGWLSGHLHTNTNKSGLQQRFRSYPVGGRTMWGINGPAAGGGLATGITDENHQWEGENTSLYITYLGDRIDVRWRDNNAKQWTGHPDVGRVKQILL